MESVVGWLLKCFAAFFIYQTGYLVVNCDAAACTAHLSLSLSLFPFSSLPDNAEI